MGFLGFGKSQKQKELEKDLSFLNGLHDILTMSSFIHFTMDNSSERKKVIMAIFFETIIHIVFKKYNEADNDGKPFYKKAGELYRGMLTDEVSRLLIKKIENEDYKIVKYDRGHVNEARNLISKKDTKAKLVVKAVFKMFDDFYAGNSDYGYALNNAISNKSIKWKNISHQS